MRVFVAIYPDEPARGELADVAPDDADDVRATDMADWHVTIRFLGELEATCVTEVGDAAATAFAAVPATRARLGPTTALGTGAKVLFVPVEGVDHLAEVLDAAIHGLAPARDLPYRGHLTLARARGRGRLPGSLSGRPVSLSFPVSEVALVQSRLEPDRAVYRVLRRFPLQTG